ncbi:hypothetical protein GUJ93_ZPchr0003g16549 [Zizania palustris]|uniref:Uncharacterized protein n=1 Tax=Zizania palustris TaxID=103762 RepID=A0A8J5RT10_ZIZPA|nr:hypothetical protein GUJ93_ZPchr0003g16549 [Zizania palustris]
MKYTNVTQSINIDDIPDFDRMGERITTIASSESSSNNRYSDEITRVHSLKDGYTSFVDREHTHFGGRTSFQDQESAHYSPRRETYATRRGNYPMKDSYDGFATDAVKPSSRGRTTDSPWASEDYHHRRVPRWDSAKENDRFEKQSDFDSEFFNSNRPRYSMRQPRVPPPPTVARSTIDASAQHANSSFVESGMRESSSMDEHTTQSRYGHIYQEASRQYEILAEVITLDEQQSGYRENPVWGSQSSISVSSPPSSPPHVSHDEMDVSGDSPVLLTPTNGNQTMMSDNGHLVSILDAANTSRITASSTISHLEDDEWPSENNEDHQKQDEYDEESNSYQEDEINEVDDENLDLDGEFAEGHSTHIETEPVILGFDEGVQAEIPPNPELELISMKHTEREIGVHSSVMEQEMCSGSICPSDFVTEAEQALQDLTLDQVNALTEETNSEPSSSLVSSVSGSKLPQASSTYSIMPPASAVSSRSEVLVNLQFGLFSGPSLIPTPVPAIQIGSIQMPIHLNQINQSLVQVHPSPAPLFQFGKLRYMHPIAQNVRPVSQATPSVHSSAPAPYILNQYASSGLPNEINQHAQQNIPREAASPSSTDKSVVPAAKFPFVMEHSDSRKLNGTAINLMVDAVGFQNLPDRSSLGENTTCKVSKSECHRNHDISLKRNYKSTSNNRESSQVNPDAITMSIPKAPGDVPDGRGKKYGYAVKELNMRLASSIVDHSNKDSRVFQRKSRRNTRRTEFRVRENVGNNTIQDLESFSHSEQNDKPHSNATREISVRNVNIRESDESFRANEASDLGADGFIEVRSKRQIMSVKRELREKENRTKMRTAKASRKPHQVSLHRSSSPNSNKGTFSLAEPVKKAYLDSVMPVKGRVIDPVESSVTLNGDKASMTPIGPPLVNTESQYLIHTTMQRSTPFQSQPTSDTVNSSAAVKVMSLTQTQLDEAMKPVKFEQAGSGFSLESNNALSPTVTSDKAFPSSASPINSLLSGEKIQGCYLTNCTASSQTNYFKWACSSRVNSIKEAMHYLQHHWELGHNATLGLSHFMVLRLGLLALSLALEEYLAYKVLHIWLSTLYNHFAPVGQFGQMGLGFMGATYIPGDKQPDWKQNQGPSVVGVSQSDPSNQNMVPGQVSSASVPTPVQHLHPASIMPIPSPLTMFDIAPFQTSTDIQMQPCWPHMPEPSASIVPSDSSKSFPNAAATQFNDELGLVEQPASSSSNAQTVQPSFALAGMINNEVPSSAKVMNRSNTPNVNPGIATAVTSNSNGGHVSSMPTKPDQSSSSSDQQYQHPANNQDRRARMTQKTGTVNEWQRWSGYHGRNQNSGSDKNLGTGRMKQIYVAKSSSASGHAPSG